MLKKARLVIKLEGGVASAVVVMIGSTIVAEVPIEEVGRVLEQYERLTHVASKFYDGDNDEETSQ